MHCLHAVLCARGGKGPGSRRARPFFRETRLRSAAIRRTSRPGDAPVWRVRIRGFFVIEIVETGCTLPPSRIRVTRNSVASARALSIGRIRATVHDTAIIRVIFDRIRPRGTLLLGRLIRRLARFVIRSLSMVTGCADFYGFSLDWREAAGARGRLVG